MNVAAFHTSIPEAPSLKKISWEDFEHRYLEREDRYKYEWVDGEVIKTLRTMNQQQLFIFLNLEAFLDGLKLSNSNLGKLLPEVNSWFLSAYRRPDIAYFTPSQLLTARSNNQQPQFVVEIISNNDQLNKANDKLTDYRNAEVPVVWFVYPKSKQVHIYRGKQMTICTGDDICSAAPVIPGFLIPASDVFK